MRCPSVHRNFGRAGSVLVVLAAMSCTEDNSVYHPSDAQSETSLTDGGGSTETGATTEAGSKTEAGGILCAPGAFVKCASTAALLLCNSTGTGTTVVSCAPYTCDSSTKRCTECDPATTTPSCQSSNLVSCSPSGLKVTTACPGGCSNGVCTGCTTSSYYLDHDKDGFGDPKKKVDSCLQPSGYVTNALDCDDLDPSTYPGQTNYFNHATTGTGKYDYNCNGTEEKQYASLASCHLVGASCTGDGWAGAVPACGQSGSYTMCAKKQGACAAASSGLKTQECR
jgi:hypothetical protein